MKKSLGSTLNPRVRVDSARERIGGSTASSNTSNNYRVIKCICAKTTTTMGASTDTLETLLHFKHITCASHRRKKISKEERDGRGKKQKQIRKKLEMSAIHA